MDVQIIQKILQQKKIDEHIPRGYSMSTIWEFDHTGTLYRGKDCVKKIYTSLREPTKNIIDFEKHMLPLTKEELKSHKDAKVWYICGKKNLKKLSKSINYWKV